MSMHPRTANALQMCCTPCTLQQEFNGLDMG